MATTKDDVAVMLPTPTTSKPTLHALKTPKSAGSLPSELPRSPYPGTPLFLKQEEINTRTPISPPIAYTEFLKAVSSPLIKSGKSTPTSAPSSSDTSGTPGCTCEHSATSSSSSSSSSSLSSAKSPVPPSPYPHPKSAPATGAIRRLRIPPSPIYFPDSPASALSIRSPFTIRSPFEWDAEAKRWSTDGPKSAGASRPVSVRHIVTRTVTYTPRMDLAPAPKGKRRRLQ